ncbi:MAG: AAA family ATPase [Oscillospiraceae bacterium]
MIKINSLELDDVKRIRAVKLEPSENGLTIIGGKNNQGKTSVLDAIAWALGGDKFRPSGAVREGSTVPPHLKVKLSNGIIVERCGKNSDLKVTDETGKRGGQQLLNAFISSFALDLPKFMESSSKDKATVLLQIIGVGDKLFEYDREESKLYNRRLEIGRIAEQKAKYAAELPEYEGIPKEPVSASELIRQQQEILARNGENQRKRDRAEQLKATYSNISSRIEMLRSQLSELEKQQSDIAEDMRIAELSAAELHDESTEELENNIRNIEAINIKIRSNLDKEKAEMDAKQYKDEYDSLTGMIENIRSERKKLLDNAPLPLPGLSVENGELTYNGAKWDCMSASEQLRVSAAIVRKLNPECGFVLMDKLEQMDIDTLNEFGKWLEAEGLQAIATRVSTGGECSIIIEDGYVKGEGYESPQETNKTWKAGTF